MTAQTVNSLEAQIKALEIKFSETEEFVIDNKNNKLVRNKNYYSLKNLIASKKVLLQKTKNRVNHFNWLAQ